MTANFAIAERFPSECRLDAELATATGRSRHSVGRWLSGRTQPRFHEFLQLIEATTGRVHDWVAELLPIELVPSLLSAHRQAQAARDIAFEHPWAEAVLRVLETAHYRHAPEITHSTIAAWLGIKQEQLEAALTGLEDAGILTRKDGKYEAVRELTVDNAGKRSLADNLASSLAAGGVGPSRG